MSSLKVLSQSEFATEVIAADKTVIVDFFATWCMPCKAFEPILEKVAVEAADKCTVVKIDIDETPEVASKYGVRSVPTLIVFKGGEVKNRLVGRSTKENVLKLIDIEPKSEATFGG